MAEPADPTKTPPADPAGDKGGEEPKDKDSKTFTQEDLEKKLDERIKREREQADKKLSDELKKARDDWDRQAKLTEEQRADEERKKREAETSDREREITLRENRAEALDLLAEKNIPKSLVNFVVDTDLDKTKSNIEALAKDFNSAVEKAVDDRLKGKTPKDRTNPDQKQGGGAQPNKTRAGINVF